MAITFDGPNKRIVLTAGTVSLGVRDMWSRWVDWLLTSDNSKYLFALEQVGGNDIDVGAGTSIPIYAFLKNGWRIRPQEANHTLNVVDGILVVDGGGDPFVDTSGSFRVNVRYSQPVQAITVATGGGGGGGATAADVWAYGSRTLTEAPSLSGPDAAKLDELHKVHGLDPTKPLTVQPTRRFVGPSGSPDVDQSIGEAGSTVTVTRI